MSRITSLPYLDRLDSARQEVFFKLKSFSDSFILAGGTALMLQIGHRLSVDFDCFTQNEKLPLSLLVKMKRVFGRTTLPYMKSREIFLFTVSKGIHVHFVAYPYAHLEHPLATTSLPLAALADIAANKAYTIGRRGAWRDYVDLFFLLKYGYFTLTEIISYTEKKFAGEFHDKLFLEQLTYFDDLDILSTKYLRESYTDDQIKSFLEEAVKGNLKKILP